jgi:hypothetical protein
MKTSPISRGPERTATRTSHSALHSRQPNKSSENQNAHNGLTVEMGQTGHNRKCLKDKIFGYPILTKCEK